MPSEFIRNKKQSKRICIQSNRKNWICCAGTVLMDLNVLTKNDYENWRFGKTEYLEKVCKINLSKLSSIVREIETYCKSLGLKASETYYKRWTLKDKSKKIKLQFSKSGKVEIEKKYATHYLNLNRINELKLKKESNKNQS